MRTKVASISGLNLTRPATPSGEETTDTTQSSPRSSCPATSWAGCSSGWTNSTRTPSPQSVCSARTMTPPSAVSGYLKATSSPSSLTTTGRWITPATGNQPNISWFLETCINFYILAGKSWTVSLMTARSWWISTGSGREQMRRAEPSIREKYSSEDQD